MSLSGARVAVLGAGGAGRAVLASIAQAGAVALVVDRDADVARSALESSGASGRADGVDLTSHEATGAWLEEVHSTHGPLDVVLHLVGGWRGGGGFGPHAIDHAQELHDPILTTLQVASVTTIDDLRASSRGVFAMVSSTSVVRPTAGNAAYASLKAAAEAWTQAMAHALRDSDASATVVRITALLTPEIRAERPADDLSTWTPADVLAGALLSLRGQPASEVNGHVLDLAAGGYSSS
jgi:NAD(P)-dependent dehydrogenase (short-subunit alcohol dehydrogenase family)